MKNQNTYDFPECKICSGKCREYAEAVVLHKYKIKYFICDYCDFIQTEEPYWLDEAYLTPINIYDTGSLQRSILFSEITSTLMALGFKNGGRYLDYGGGFGEFVRLMRDKGFNFYIYDKYCDNLFARGFNMTDEKSTRFEMVTAFELFEHLVSPKKELEKIIQYSDNIFFTTELVPPNHPKIDEWSYYNPAHGQHIAFYSKKSLEVLAETFDMYYYNRGNFHLYSKIKSKSLNMAFKLATIRKINKLVNSMCFDNSYYKIDMLELQRRYAD